MQTIYFKKLKKIYLKFGMNSFFDKNKSWAKIILFCVIISFCHIIKYIYCYYPKPRRIRSALYENFFFEEM